MPPEGAGGAGRGSDGLHPDLLPPGETIRYLRLDEVCGSEAAARDLLNKLVHDGKIAAFAWGKTRLFHRRELDRFVSAELASIRPPSAPEAEGHANS